MDVFPFFVMTGAIIGVIGMITWSVTSVLKARHLYASEKAAAPGHSRKIELLEVENQQLRGTVARLEDRLATLERIATDPSRRLTDQIDALR